MAAEPSGRSRPSQTPAHRRGTVDTSFAGYRLRPRYLLARNVHYGPAREHHLDVWRRRDLPLDFCSPVIVYVPGGGWIHGSRRWQGYRLLALLAEEGWTCLAVDYRVAPGHRWPAHIRDVNRAIAWAREHVSTYGGDPRFLAVAGASAGGHLASLAALSRHPAFRPSCGGDTHVDAAVGLYGRYDWSDREGREREGLVSFLERVVVGRRQHEAPEVFHEASPIAQLSPEAPPFLVVHGDADSIIPVEQARAFVAALRATSRSSVSYTELPGAGHAFDLVSQELAAEAGSEITRFLDGVRRRKQTLPDAC